MKYKISDWFEIRFWRMAVWILKKGYGGNCPTSDLDDFPDMYKVPKDVFHDGRCASCRAREVIDWIEDHIRLLKS